MTSARAVDDSYFNNLSRQPSLPHSNTQNVPTTNGEAPNGDDSEVPKPKRVACAICRKRKLKCDGGRPKCGTCARLGHNCAYDEVRRKSGPKRGYVKELEARLAQVETQMKTRPKGKKPPTPSGTSQPQDQHAPSPSTDPAFTSNSGDGNPPMYSMGIPGPATDFFDDMALPNDNSTAPSMLPDLITTASPIDDGMTWEMVGLGLEEPLPTQEAIDELHEIYFKYMHPSVPMMHQYRYRAAMGLSSHMRPPVCLRYAVWCLASNLSGKYKSHQDIFYRRARRYAESDEMKGLGEVYVSVAHAQSWILIATYEFQMMFFPRAWASVGRACRLVLMMGLNRLDREGLDVKQVLAPPRDWTEREERRRTFWMAYCTDRYASMGTGWPLSVDERDVRTNLPANEDNFEQSKPEDTTSLSASMTPEGAANLSPFAGVVYMAHIFGKSLTHLHRPGADEKDDDLQGEFWKRHRQIDNTLLKTSLSLPLHLRLPAGIRSPNCVFLNMCIHTSTICLHQAALSKAEQNKLPPSLMEQSSARCLLAATEVTNIMRLISHLDCQGMNPFIAFCLYVAARVFIHILKKGPDEAEIRSSFEFLLMAMQQFKTTNPLSESFLIQLGLDLQGSGMDFLLQNHTQSSTTLAKLKIINKYEAHVGCSPTVDIRDKNKHMHPVHMAPNLASTNYGVHQIISAGGDLPSRPTQYSMQSFDLPSHPSPKPGRLGRLDGPMPDSLRKVSRGESYGGYCPSTAADLGTMDNPYDKDTRTSPPQKQGGLNNLHGPMAGLLPKATEGFAGQSFGGGFPGTATGLNDMENSYDTDMSGGQASSGATPGNSSSNTSYSPPSQHAADIGGSTISPKPTAFQAADLSTGPPKFFNFANADGNFVSSMPSQPQQINADFDLSSSTWNFDSSGASPSNFTTGLTPAADGEWSQILENMSWDSTMVDANAGHWTTSPGGPT